MFENNPREIKFKIGIKEYDKKVSVFYNLLVKSVDSYTNSTIIGEQLFWDTMLFDQFTNEDSVIQIQKMYSLSKWDQKNMQKHIHKLSLLDELEYKLYSHENGEVDFEFMCFAKALVFYLNKLESIRDYSISKANSNTDVIIDKMLPFENLNYYKLYIAKNSNKLYNDLHSDYLERIGRIGKEKFSIIEKNEFSRLLSTDDKGNDYLYLEPRIEFHGFHEPVEIRTIAMKLLNGSYYDILFHFGTGKEKVIMSEVLAIQKYIDFLNTQLPIESKAVNETKIAPIPKTKTLKPSFRLVNKENNLLDLVCLKDKLEVGGVIFKLKDAEFEEVFSGLSKSTINFVRKGNKGGGLMDVLWLMYLLREEFELINKEDDYREQIKNCFLLDGVPITSTVGQISTMLSAIRKPYYDEKNNKINNFKKYSSVGKKKLNKTQLLTNIIFDAISESIITKDKKHKF